MYHASKRLQAIRRQLKHMDKLYMCGSDDEGQSEAAESPDGSKFEWADVMHGSRSLSNISYSSPMSVERQDLVESRSVNSSTAMTSVPECASVELDEIPLSEELRCAISNMTDLDDVDGLIGNMIDSMQVETSYDEELQTIDNSVILFNNEPDDTVRHSNITELTQENNGALQENGSKIFLTTEENWRKDRKKKDNHNIIERRRRYNINDRIKELASLLPSSVPTDLKQNKGSILKTSVEYMKELIKSKQKLQKLEEHQKMMDSKVQKLFIRIFQMELKFKLYGLTEDLKNSRGKKKKRSKKSISEINAMVEALVKESMPESAQQRKSKPVLPSKMKNVAPNNKQNISPDAKSGLRQHLNKKMSTGGPTRNDTSSIKGVNDQSQHRIRDQSPPLLGTTSDGYLGKSNPRMANSQQYVLDTDGNVQIGLKEGEQIIELSPEQCNILLELFESNGNEPPLNTDSSPQPDVSAKQECLSPVTSTSNMLERLLRRSDTSSDGCSDCSGLEESTESEMELR